MNRSRDELDLEAVSRGCVADMTEQPDGSWRGLLRWDDSYPPGLAGEVVVEKQATGTQQEVTDMLFEWLLDVPRLP